MENIYFKSELEEDELKSIEGGKNVLEYLVYGAGYFVEWMIDHDDVLEAPRPIGMY